MQPWHYKQVAMWLGKYPEGKEVAVCLEQRKLNGKVRERVSSVVQVGVSKEILTMA